MKNLHDNKDSIQFYEKRYEKGYMEEWDELKKNMVKEVLSSLPLPSTGKALDFGCGNGVFTKIIKEALPGWEVYGVEISKTAVRNASRRISDCIFFTADEAMQYSHQFDFLFSHHVLEHVPDLTDSFSTIDAYLKNNAFQLHILPCGNSGSLEYRICEMRKNGIEKDKGNRFFFEEPGHLRRVNTAEMEAYAGKTGFKKEKEFYANQYDGSINWITKASPRFVKKLTATDDAIDSKAAGELLALRKKLLPLVYLQFPYTKYRSIKSKWHKKASDYIKLIVLFFPSIVSRLVYDQYEKKAAAEWVARNQEKNGSEMFLFFKR